MLFRFSLLSSALLAATASAKSLVPGSTLAADSKAGLKLLSKSRRVEGEQDFTWVYKYDIKYVGCHETTQFAGEEGGQQAEDGNPLYTQRLVHYYLCPSGTCSSSGNTMCTNGAEYIVDLREFVDAFTEARMEEQEWKCEQVRETCYCDNYNDDQRCENSCFTQQGLDYCVENDYEEEFEVQRYLECNEMENGNGYLFIGPYCSDNKILLGVFQDETCTTPAEEGAYEKYNYGQKLQYSDESLVDSKCISCEEVDRDNNNGYNNNNNNNNGYNQNNDHQLSELCERMYEMAGKCESNLQVDSYYFSPNTKACNFIHNTLPKLESASSGGGGNGALIAFLVIFAVAACGLGYYSWTLHKKLQRGNVDLSAQDASGDRYATMT